MAKTTGRGRIPKPGAKASGKRTPADNLKEWLILKILAAFGDAGACPPIGRVLQNKAGCNGGNCRCVQVLAARRTLVSDFAGDGALDALDVFAKFFRFDPSEIAPDERNGNAVHACRQLLQGSAHLGDAAFATHLWKILTQPGDGDRGEDPFLDTSGRRYEVL